MGGRLAKTNLRVLFWIKRTRFNNQVLDLAQKPEDPIAV